MIGYTTLGVRDLERARAFYDAVLQPLGGRRTLSYERSQYYGAKGGAMLGVVLPHDGAPATAGNGTMVALAAETDDQIAQVHALALANGGVCEGPPGERGGGFFGAYFRDLDGNKLCVFRMERR
ncbi:VOC family protein [Phenylobacterium sp.]|uniref:VOC family protein n=1 Tax=Phenylobacterium sp. TaxID=1871053 RepID=UPI002F941C9C